MPKPWPNFRFPAEWEPHASTWLTWPHNIDTWPRNLREAQSEFESFVRTLGEVEQVNILATGHLAGVLEKRFAGHQRIRIFDIPTNDSWIRDYGPTFVKSVSDDSLGGIDWTYNGWGEKYPPFDDDQQVAFRILSTLGIQRIGSSLIIEGGAIESNGQTICLTTHSCQHSRNPNWGKERIRGELIEKLGLPEVLIVDCIDIEGDDTDGHIDQVARFVSSNQVVVSQRQMEVVAPELRAAELDLVCLTDPDPVQVYGHQLPVSYTNFYIANGIVVVPQFGVKQDQTAIGLIRELFPNRQIIGLSSRHLSVGLGSFHCLSQQQPA